MWPTLRGGGAGEGGERGGWGGKGGAGGRGWLLVFCLAAFPLLVVVVFWWFLNKNGLLGFNLQQRLMRKSGV